MGLTACREGVERVSTQKTETRPRPETETRGHRQKRKQKKYLRLPNFVRTLRVALFLSKKEVANVETVTNAGRLWKGRGARTERRRLSSSGRCRLVIGWPAMNGFRLLHVAAGPDRRTRFVRKRLAPERNVGERRSDRFHSGSGLSGGTPSEQRRRHFGELRFDAQGFLLPRDLLQQRAFTTTAAASAFKFANSALVMRRNGCCLFNLMAVASACSVEIYLDRRLITVDPVDVGNRPDRIGVVVPFHPHASGDDASLKGSRNRRGDFCGMSAVEQRSSKIDQFSRVRDHATTSARLNFMQAKHLRAAFGSVTVGYRLLHSQPRCADATTAIPLVPGAGYRAHADLEGK